MGGKLGHRSDVSANDDAVEHEHGGFDGIELPESGMAL